jgi:nucleoside-diphosphate-sugar epimerase
MKLLITGATGFIGKSLVAEALSQGYHVVALVRNQAPVELADLKNLEIITCDLDEDEIPDLCNFSIDCVVHLAASMNPKAMHAGGDLLLGTKKLTAEMQRSGIKKLIGMSSISVLDYEHTNAHAIINEETNVSRNYPRMGYYSVLKSQQEDVYRAYGANDGNQCVILRPGLVYDLVTLNSAHAGIIKSKFQLLVNHKGKVPLVNLASLVNAALKAVSVDVCKVETIHLLDDDLPSQAQYLAALRNRKIIKAGGIVFAWWLMLSLIMIVFPIANMFNKTRVLPDVFFPHAFASRMKPFFFSNSKAKQLLNWQPKSFQ